MLVSETRVQIGINYVFLTVRGMVQLLSFYHIRFIVTNEMQRKLSCYLHKLRKPYQFKRRKGILSHRALATLHFDSGR